MKIAQQLTTGTVTFVWPMKLARVIPATITEPVLLWLVKPSVLANLAGTVIAVTNVRPVGIWMVLEPVFWTQLVCPQLAVVTELVMIPEALSHVPVTLATLLLTVKIAQQTTTGVEIPASPMSPALPILVTITEPVLS